MNTSLIVVSPKIHEFPFKVPSIPEEDMVKVFTANGSDVWFNEVMQSGPIKLSPDNFQLRQHWPIQQINRLLKPLILHECCIRLLSCHDRSMAEQMLNISNSSATTQQTSGESLSQIVRGNICTDLPQSCQPLGR